jgi:hypothetical protein
VVEVTHYVRFPKFGIIQAFLLTFKKKIKKRLQTSQSLFISVALGRPGKVWNVASERLVMAVRNIERESKTLMKDNYVITFL